MGPPGRALRGCRKPAANVIQFVRGEGGHLFGHRDGPLVVGYVTRQTILDGIFELVGVAVVDLGRLLVARASAQRQNTAGQMWWSSQRKKSESERDNTYSLDVSRVHPRPVG